MLRVQVSRNALRFLYYECAILVQCPQEEPARRARQHPLADEFTRKSEQAQNSSDPYRSNRPGKMPEEWKEPFANVMAAHTTLVHMAPMFVGSAVKQRLLSERVLFVVLQLADQNDAPFHEKVDLGEGAAQTLLSLSVQVIEQSYELASSTFDEPQLAILAVHILCLLCKRFSSAIDALLRLARADQLAQARVLRHGIANGLPLEGNVDNLLVFLLQDFRVLVKHHHTLATGILVDSLVALAPLLDAAETPHQSFEVIYLLAEYYLVKGDYWRVLKTPETFAPIWQLYVQDKASLEIQARPVKLCMARAMEAIGDISSAREMFASCGVQDLKVLDSCLAGKQLYVSAQPVVPVRGIRDLSSRELCDGRLALVFRQESEGNHKRLRLRFAVFEPESGSLVDH